MAEAHRIRIDMSMRTINKSNTEKKRTLILQAALLCFAKTGLQKTSLKDICKAAGMRAGHLYYYFPTKESIVEAVYQIGTDELVAHIERMLDADDFINALVDVHAEAETHRRAWNISPGLRLEFQAESTRNASLRAIYEKEEKRISDATLVAINNAISTGNIDPCLDSGACARAIMLLWSGFASLRIMEGFDLEEYRKAISVLLDPWRVNKTKSQ